MRSKIRVVLAEDHKAFLYGLETFLKDREDIEVVASAVNGEDLLRIVKIHQPDVVVTDLFMPKLSGKKLIQALKKAGMDRIVICTMMEGNIGTIGVLQSGAMSIVNKGSELEEVARAILSTYDHQPYFCNCMSGKVNFLINTYALTDMNKYLFTDEEKKIIELICKEMTSAEIASHLYKSKKVIDRARTRIFEKMGVKSIAGLVVYAIRNSMYSDFHPNFVL